MTRGYEDKVDSRIATYSSMLINVVLGFYRKSKNAVLTPPL